MRRGLFLDLDGTLCDSVPSLRAAYARFVERRGGTADDAEFESLNGATLDAIVARLCEAHAFDEPPSELAADYRQEIVSARADSVPMEGALDLLGAALERGWRVAVVTSGEAPAALRWLAEHELDRFVECVVGGDDVAASKPDPDGYLTALRRLGCDPAVSVAVEDSASGVRAALAAGLETFHFAALQPSDPASFSAAVRIAKLSELIPRLERSASSPGAR